MPTAFLSEDERARVETMGSEGKWLLGKAESAMQELEAKVTSLQADLDAEKSNTGAVSPRRARLRGQGAPQPSRGRRREPTERGGAPLPVSAAGPRGAERPALEAAVALRRSGFVAPCGAHPRRSRPVTRGVGAEKTLATARSSLVESRSKVERLEQDLATETRAKGAAEAAKDDALGVASRRQQECDQLNGGCRGGRGPCRTRRAHRRRTAAEEVKSLMSRLSEAAKRESMAQEEAASLRASAGPRDSELASAQRELKLAREHTTWLEKELKTKSEALMSERKRSSDREVELEVRARRRTAPRCAAAATAPFPGLGGV